MQIMKETLWWLIPHRFKPWKRATVPATCRRCGMMAQFHEWGAR
jgi:hypothetical protein